MRFSFKFSFIHCCSFHLIKASIVTNNTPNAGQDLHLTYRLHRGRDFTRNSQ